MFRLLSFIMILFSFYSCTRFSRGSDSSNMSGDAAGTRTEEEVDYSKFNAVFEAELTPGTGHNKVLNNSASHRSLANFFFYNQERVLAGISNKFDVVNYDIIGNSESHETINPCDFKSIDAWNSVKYDLKFDRLDDEYTTEYRWDNMCNAWFDKSSDRRSCKNVHPGGSPLLSTLFKRLHDEETDLFVSLFNSGKLDDYRVNQLWNEYLTYCLNSTTDDRSYWDFTDYFNANGKTKYKFTVAAPKKITTIRDMNIEFGFNLDANRQIVSDTHAFLKLDIKMIDADNRDKTMSATFAYSKEPIKLRACLGTYSDGACKNAIEARFTDSCGEILFVGDLVETETNVEIRNPYVLFRNDRLAYSDPQCHFNGKQVMSSGDNVPASVDAIQNILNFSYDNIKWASLFCANNDSSCENNDITMEETK